MKRVMEFLLSRKATRHLGRDARVKPPALSAVLAPVCLCAGRNGFSLSMCNELHPTVTSTAKPHSAPTPGSTSTFRLLLCPGEFKPDHLTFVKQNNDILVLQPVLACPRP